MQCFECKRIIKDTGNSFTTSSEGMITKEREYKEDGNKNHVSYEEYTGHPPIEMFNGQDMEYLTIIFLCDECLAKYNLMKKGK